MKDVYLKSILPVFFLVSLLFSFKLISSNPRKALSPSIKEKVIIENLTIGSVSLSQPCFTENKGQICGYDGLPHPEVKFAFNSGNLNVFLMEKGIAYQFTKVHYPEGFQEVLRDKLVIKNFGKLEEMQKQVRTETFRMNMSLVGANDSAVITTEYRSEDYANYYTNNILGVYNYQKIIYHEVYPGIDWIIYTKNSGIKYDFIVKPGANPSLIKMEYTNQEELSLNQNGSITLKSEMGSITEESPETFQGKERIFSQYILDKNFVFFKVGNYNKKQPLIIDPAVTWATYFGGTNSDYGYSCTTDVFGNVYLAGSTSSPFQIAANGHQNIFGGFGSDAFLTKLDGKGKLLWSTYYGGIGYFTGDDHGFSCVTDTIGNVYLTGITNSTTNISSIGSKSNPISTYSGSDDAFLVKFNTKGTRLWGIYYGGSSRDVGYSCATDVSGNVYLAGTTNSTANIAFGGHQNNYGGNNGDPFYGDAFLVKFDNNGTRLWSTYYGGSGYEDGNSCFTDSYGNVYLAGRTTSSSNIASGGHQNNLGGGTDAFLVKFDINGTRLWATYYGDIGGDEGYSCSTDAHDNIYLGGATNSTANIASGGHQNVFGGYYDAFLVKFDSNGTRLWASYYGGEGGDLGFSYASRTLGYVYLSGTTNSSANIAFGGQQNAISGNDDAYYVIFDSTGARLWAGYFGGSDYENGSSLSVDAFGNIYMSGTTSSTSNIAYKGLINKYRGNDDAFLVKFCGKAPIQPHVVDGNTIVCKGENQTYSITINPEALSYIWGLSGSSSGTSTTNIISVTIGASGVYSVSAVNACGAGQVQTLSITVDECTGIKKIQKENAIVAIYPNPGKGFYTIATSENSKEVKYAVYNTLGVKILESSTMRNTSQIDISSFSNGVYMFVIHNLKDKGTITLKVIKD